MTLSIRPIQYQTKDEQNWCRRVSSLGRLVRPVYSTCLLVKQQFISTAVFTGLGKHSLNLPRMNHINIVYTAWKECI
jgi:hypothetical protein